MNEPDFSGIKPQRVPTARKRLAAVQEYLSLSNRSQADTERLAKSVGLTRTSLQRLVNAWIAHRRTDLLVENKSDPTHKKRRIPDAVVDIMKQEILKAGPGASLTKLRPVIATRCAEAGFKAPSKGSIDRFIGIVRAAEPVMIDRTPRIVVGRIWFHLPIGNTTNGQIVDPMPHIIAAVALPEGVVLRYQIGINAKLPNVEQLMTELLKGQSDQATPRPLVMDAYDRRVCQPIMLDFGIRKFSQKKAAAQSEMKRAFGNKFWNLEPIYRHGKATPNRRHVISKQDEPLNPMEGAKAIQTAIERHNTERMAGPLEYRITPNGAA